MKILSEKIKEMVAMRGGYKLEAVLLGEDEVQIFTSMNISSNKMPLGLSIPIVEDIIDCKLADIVTIGVDNPIDILKLISKETGSIFCMQENSAMSYCLPSVKFRRA